MQKLHTKLRSLPHAKVPIPFELRPPSHLWHRSLIPEAIRIAKETENGCFIKVDEDAGCCVVTADTEDAVDANFYKKYQQMSEPMKEMVRGCADLIEKMKKQMSD